MYTFVRHPGAEKIDKSLGISETRSDVIFERLRDVFVKKANSGKHVLLMEVLQQVCEEVNCADHSELVYAAYMLGSIHTQALCQRKKKKESLTGLLGLLEAVKDAVEERENEKED